MRNGVTFGSVIHRRRRELGVRVGDLADACRISNSYVHGLEGGYEYVDRPSPRVCYDVADALNLPRDLMLTLAGRVPREVMDEMRALYDRGDLHRDLSSMRCVGYRQAWGFLEGEYGMGEMRQKAVAATRQLAKRQLTWLRQEQSALWYDPTVGEAQESVFGKVCNFLE